MLNCCAILFNMHRCIKPIFPAFSNACFLYSRITKKKKTTSSRPKQPPVASVAAVSKSLEEERADTISNGHTVSASIPMATQKPPLVSANRDDEIAKLMEIIEPLQKEKLYTASLPEIPVIPQKKMMMMPICLPPII
jgi:hypothetical protein